MHVVLFIAGSAGVVFGLYLLRTIASTTNEAELMLASGFAVAIIGFSVLTIGLAVIAAQLRQIRDRLPPR